jgi:hypothetical protein
MKTKILFIGILLIFSVGVFAQTINLSQNDVKTFQLKNPSANVASASWNDNGGGYVNDAGSKSFTKTYSSQGSFTLSVYPVSDLGCNGDIKSYTINVVPTVVTLTEQVSIVSIPAICPLTTGNPSGGQATVNLSTATFSPALGGAETWSVSYQIGAAAPVSVSIPNGGTSFTISNLTTSSTIYIMGFTHGTNTTLYNTTNAPQTALTVNPAPTIDDIF